MPEGNYQMLDFRDAFFGQVYEMAKADKRVVFLTADMGAFVLEDFKRDMPDRFYNVGIAEQNMINIAIGMSLAGKRVFAYAIAAFVIYRCYEQIKLGMGDERLPIVLIGSGPGLSYAWDGPSHHCLHDIPLMMELGIKILTPQSDVQAQEAARIAYDSQGPVYVRLPTKKLRAQYGRYKDDYSDVPFILESGRIP